jgi:hypothetical protein
LFDGGLAGAPGGLSGVTGGEFGAFFDWIDGLVFSCTLKVHVSD